MNDIKNKQSYKGSGQAITRSGRPKPKPKYIKPYGKDEFLYFALQPETNMPIFREPNYQKMSIVSSPEGHGYTKIVKLTFKNWNSDSLTDGAVEHTIVRKEETDKYFSALQMLKQFIDPKDEILAGNSNIELDSLNTTNMMGIPQKEESLIKFLRNSIDFIGIIKQKQSLQTAEAIALNTISLEYEREDYDGGDFSSPSGKSIEEKIIIFNENTSDGEEKDESLNNLLTLNEALQVWLAYLEFYKYFPLDTTKEWQYNLDGVNIPSWEVIAAKNNITIGTRSKDKGKARYKLFLKYLSSKEENKDNYNRVDGPEIVSKSALQNLIGEIELQPITRAPVQEEEEGNLPANTEQTADAPDIDTFIDQQADIRTDDSGDFIFDEDPDTNIDGESSQETGETVEPQDGNTSSTPRTDNTQQQQQEGKEEGQGQGQGQGQEQGDDESSKTQQGTDSGSGSGSGSGNGGPFQTFLSDNGLRLGKIRGDGDCLFVALLRILRMQPEQINPEMITNFRSRVVDYITGESSRKRRRLVSEIGGNRVEESGDFTFWDVYGETILAQVGEDTSNPGLMYDDKQDYINTMKSTLVNPHKPAGRFGSVFEIMAFKEMFSQQLNDLYGSNVIQIVKLDGNNNLVLETPPSSQSRNIAEVDFSLPILLYNRTHYDIAEPLPDVVETPQSERKTNNSDVVETPQPGSKTRDPDVVETPQPGSKTRDPDVVETPQPERKTHDTSKGLMHYVETIFSMDIGEEEQEKINELRSLIQ